MSYTPTVWSNGDIITPEKLNKIENGLAAIIDYTPRTWVQGDIITAGDLNQIEAGIAKCFNYNRTVWHSFETITASRLNKIEEALEWAAKPFSDLTWDEVVQSVNDGKYKLFELGSTKDIDLGVEGVINVQIVAKDTDIKSADGTPVALTFASKKLVADYHQMNPANDGDAEGTGTIGGWPICDCRLFLQQTIKPLIPAIIRNNLKTVVKYSTGYNASGTVENNMVSNDDIWLLSAREIFGGESYETEGPDYSARFPDTITTRMRNQGGSYYSYWLRSAESTLSFKLVSATGSLSDTASNRELGVGFGFCL